MTKAIRIRRTRTDERPGNTYERLGYCKKCGQCCYIRNSNPGLWGSLPESPLGPDTRQGTNEDESATVVIQDKCYQHGEDNLCTIYKDRPAICRDWPSHPNDLLPGCGYFFMELDPMGKLVMVHRAEGGG